MKDNVPVLTQCQQKDAPWNQTDPEPIEVDCCVSYCMSKSMPITVKNYSDNDGKYSFEDTNFIDEFSDSNAMGLTSLLAELLKLSEERVATLEDELTLTSSSATRKQIQREIMHYMNVSKASEGWIVDDLDVEIE